MGHGWFVGWRTRRLAALAVLIGTFVLAAGGSSALAGPTLDPAAADVSIETSASVEPVVAGTQLTYTVSVANAAGASAAEGVQILDDTSGTPLSGVQYCEVLTGDTTCAPTSPYSGTIDVGELMAGSTATYMISGHLPSDRPDGEQFTNPASVTTDTANVSTQTTSPVTSNVIARASVSIVKTASPEPVIAGTDLTYTLTVSNGGPSDALNVAINDSLASTPLVGAKYCQVVSPATSCTPVNNSSSDYAGSISVGTLRGVDGTPKSATFLIVAHVPSGVLDGATISNSASVTTDTTNTASAAQKSSSVTSNVIARDHLVAKTMIADDYHLFAKDPTKDPSQPGDFPNATKFKMTFVNAGPSDAQHVSFTAPDGPFAGESYFVIDSVCLVHGAVDCSLPGDFHTGDIGPIVADSTGLSTLTAYVKVHVNLDLGHYSPGPIATGALSAAKSLTLTSATRDINYPDLPNGDETTTISPNAIRIDTVPAKPRNLVVLPGNGNAILTWEPPADGGQSILSYTVSVSPATVGPFSVPATPAGTTPCLSVLASDCYQLSFSIPNGTYTFSVRAISAVGKGDAATASAKPSADARAQTIPRNTAQTLTTCTTATTAHPICVQYIIPSGTGGLFGAEGNVSPTTNLCGPPPASCFQNGARLLSDLTGYNNPKLPLSEIITFDSTQIPSSYKTFKACASNSTKIDCYPNNILFVSEMSFALQLVPDPGGEPLNLHFCSAPIKPDGSGGAGNANYARPDPHSGPYLGFKDTPGHGYTDTAGSACLKKVNVLGSKPDAAANGDVQIQVNLTSDSDQLIGKH